VHDGPGARREGFRDVVPPTDGTAIFAPGTDEATYYDIPLLDGRGARHGYLVVSAAAPHRVIEYSDRGEGPTTRLRARTSGSVARISRLDVALYVAEDEQHRVVAQTARSISKIDRTGARARLVRMSPEEAIIDAARARVVTSEKGVSTKGLLDWFDPPPPPSGRCDVPGDVPKYTQISPGAGPNDSSCASGCGPTAWAMIVGWASRRASANGSSDGAFAGLFRTAPGASGAPLVAPLAEDDTVDDTTWTLRNALGTFCLTDQGATTPWSMDDMQSFIDSRAPGVSTEVDYSSLMQMDSSLRDHAALVVCSGRPVILGIGSTFNADMHYPVASAYEDGWFWLNMGWGGDGDAWYETSTWFVGSVRHD
jgi:hypothetical protein